jgi:hypothetical protein
LTPSRPENETPGNERDGTGSRRNETAAQKANCLGNKRVRFPAAPPKNGCKGLSRCRDTTAEQLTEVVAFHRLGLPLALNRDLCCALS